MGAVPPHKRRGPEAEVDFVTRSGTQPSAEGIVRNSQVPDEKVIEGRTPSSWVELHVWLTAHPATGGFGSYLEATACTALTVVDEHRVRLSGSQQVIRVGS